MIKIRYRDPNELSPGLHAAAERHGRNTTVYLLPGLSAEQRRSALRRLKISARPGYDPRLPAGQLAVALLADRIRTSVGRAGAVFRSHPAGSTVPVMVVSAGAIAFLALSAVSIRVIHNAPRGAGTGAAGPAGSVTAGPGPGPSAGPIAAGLGNPPGQAGSITEQRGQPGSGNGTGNGAGQPGNGAQAGHGTGTGAGGTSQGADPAASSGGGTTLTGGQAPTPTPAGGPGSAAPGTSSSAAAPAASATTSKPSPTPTASKRGLCVNVGSLGLCL